MPAQKPTIRRSVIAILIALLAISIPQIGAFNSASAKETDPVTNALKWLVQNQLPDGSYGPYTEHETAAAADALWIGVRRSPSTLLAYHWLTGQMDNPTSWFWGSFGEADVPGAILHSFDATRQVKSLNLSIVAPNLQNFQQPNGGFKGYFDPTLYTQVTSSVDTAEALWGLIGARSIPGTSEQLAVQYLFQLQQRDGSFKLTSTVVSDPLYSLGPEPISITALVLLALRDASFTTNDLHVSSALGFLDHAASTGFNGYVYAAALSALAFSVFHDPIGNSEALAFIPMKQNLDGGFADKSRSSAASNALDTGWAAIALQLSGHGSPREITGPRLSLSALGSGPIGIVFRASSEATDVVAFRILETCLIAVSHFTTGLLPVIAGHGARVLIRPSFS